MRYFVGEESAVRSENYQICSVDFVLEYFKTKEMISLDTETEGLDPHSKKVLSLQLGNTEDQFFIDLRVINPLRFKELLESKLLLIQNSKFDYKVLKAVGINIEKIYDPMLAECIIYAGYESFGYSLQALVDRYLGIKLDKEVRSEFHKITNGAPFTDRQIVYGCEDVRHLEKIRELQLIKIKQYQLEYCLDLENQCVKALADIEYNGMYLNIAKWKLNAREYEDTLVSLEASLDEIIRSEPKLAKFVPKYIQSNLFGDYERDLRINYASPLQIKDICWALGYQIDSTNDRELGKLIGKHVFFKVLRSYRETSKVCSTYGVSFLDNVSKVTNRLHTTFWQVLVTGRVSSGDPNIQNIPQDNVFRNCFEAIKGNKWVSLDYSGQELRVMADGSGEPGFINVLNDKSQDLHCYVGSMMMGKVVTKENKEDRNKAKTLNFCKPYGGGPPKVADLLNISLDESNKLFELYEKAFPILNRWLANQGKAAKMSMQSRTFKPSNRVRWYPDLKKARDLRKEENPDWSSIMKIEGQAERNGMNHPIQGTGADLIKESLIETRELVKSYNTKYGEGTAFLISTVHDELNFEVREDLADEFGQKAKEIMIQVGTKYLKRVKMEVDLTITNYWKK